MNDTATYERDLTPSEIDERTAMHLQLAQQIEENLGSVESKRKEIRMLNQARKKLDIRSSEVLRELRTGKVFEGAQVSLALDLYMPDPFAARYPMASDHERLHSELAVVLQGVLVPSIEQLERWHPSGVEFQTVANWSRTELAYMNAKEHPDLELGPRMPLPLQLFELRAELARAVEARKRGSKREARHGEGELLDAVELRHLITCVRPRELWPSLKDVERWHPEVRADVQRWCRAEHAKAHPIAGVPLPLPPATGMPEVLSQVAFKDIPPPGRPGKRKPAKPRPASGTPMRKQPRRRK